MAFSIKYNQINRKRKVGIFSAQGLVGFPAMCYTYTRKQPKGKPVARRGPRLRSNAFALSYAGLGEVPKRKFWNKAWAKLKGPVPYGIGQPVTAIECVSFDPSPETYPSEARMDFILSPSLGGQNILSEHGEAKDNLARKPMPKKTFKNQGFTLVEVLIAIGILTVVIVGLLQLFVYCSTLAEAAGNTTLAVNETQNKMEEIRNHNFSTLAVDYASGGTPGNTFTLTSLNGTGTITISQFGGSSSLLQTQINVSWQNKNSRNFSTALTSLIARR